MLAGQFRREMSTLENVEWEGSFHTTWLAFVDVTSILPKSLGQLQKQKLPLRNVWFSALQPAGELHRRCWREAHPAGQANSLCNEGNYQRKAWRRFILCIIKFWGIQGCAAGACNIRGRMAVWGSQSYRRRSMGIQRHWELTTPLWESLLGK